MKITISSNGDAFLGDPKTRLRIGNAANAIPDEIRSNDQLDLELELPNFHCNIGGEDPTVGQLACLMCPRSRRDFQPETDRVDEVCEALAPHVAQIDQLRITGLAEPFYQGRIFEVLEKIGVSPKQSIKVFTVTNGLLLDKPARDRWFSLVPDSEVRFSIDAGTPETYVRIRRVPVFEVAVENLNQYCRQRNPNRHMAILSNNINLLNIDEIEQMIEMTKENFCHFLSLVPTSPIDEVLQGICVNPSNRSQFVEAAKSAEEKAEQRGVQVVFAGNWPK